MICCTACFGSVVPQGREKSLPEKWGLQKELTGCYPEKFCLLVILCKCSFAWMSVGGCCPLCPRYLLVLFTLFATSKGFLRVVNSLDLFIRQHICIDGGGFERLVSHQFLGSLNVTSNRLHQNSECMSGAVEYTRRSKQ